MRTTIVVAGLLVTALVVSVAAQLLARGAPGGGTFVGLFLLKALGWLACMLAVLALLGRHRPPARSGDGPGLLLQQLQRCWWVPEGLVQSKHRTAWLLMVGGAALIVNMLLGSVCSGSIATLLGRQAVQWGTQPMAFVVHFILWACCGWVLGWHMPRRLLRMHAQQG